MREELAKIDEEILSLEEENNRLNKEKGEQDTSDERKNEIGKKIEANGVKIENYKKDRDSLSKGIERARGLMVGGVATALASNVEIPTSKAEKDIESVSRSVKEIVLEIVKTDDRGHLCFAYLKEDANESKNPTLSNICKEYFTNANAAIKSTTELKAETLKLYTTCLTNSWSNLSKCNRLFDHSRRYNDFGLGMGKALPELRDPFDLGREGT